MKLDLYAGNLQLRKNLEIGYETAAEMYDHYGCHISTAEVGDVCLQAVDYGWLDLPASEAEALLVDRSEMSADEAAWLVARAQTVRRDMEAIEERLEAAAAAAVAGELSECLSALREASSLESEHGDDPATQALAIGLLDEAPEKTAL